MYRLVFDTILAALFWMHCNDSTVYNMAAAINPLTMLDKQGKCRQSIVKVSGHTDCLLARVFFFFFLQ